jgi:hypothetical protein
MLIYDDIYAWKGFGGQLNLASGECHLRIFDLRKGSRDGASHLRPIIVIVDDIEGGAMSVRSCCGHIATHVSRDFDIDHQRMMFIEHYPEVVYGEKQEHLIPEKYEVVEFNWTHGGAIQPRWRVLKPPLLDMIIKTAAESSGPGHNT